MRNGNFGDCISVAGIEVNVLLEIEHEENGLFQLNLLRILSISSHSMSKA